MYLEMPQTKNIAEINMYRTCCYMVIYLKWTQGLLMILLLEFDRIDKMLIDILCIHDR